MELSSSLVLLLSISRLLKSLKKIFYLIKVGSGFCRFRLIGPKLWTNYLTSSHCHRFVPEIAANISQADTHKLKCQFHGWLIKWVGSEDTRKLTPQSPPLTSPNQFLWLSQLCTNRFKHIIEGRRRRTSRQRLCPECYHEFMSCHLLNSIPSLHSSL